MPRAKRYFMPGYLYHITHRCHDKVFLLKDNNDKKRWLHWMSRGIQKYGLHILNYCITDNHIHLVVNPQSSRTVIARTMHLVAGRTGQEYNQRNYRNGAFWEDRYHATAVQSKNHLIKCLLYVDFNMVRAGVVTHPLEWPYCGFTEMMQPASAEHIINRQSLVLLTGFSDWEKFLTNYKKMINDGLAGNIPGYDDRWTKSLAVGDKDFVEQIKINLGYRGKYRKLENDLVGTDQESMWHLRESCTSYERVFPEDLYNESNLIFWEDDIDEHMDEDML